MKLSINWLREYLDFDCSLEQLAERLTMAGLEVEEISTISAEDSVAHGGGALEGDTVFDVKVTPNRGDWLSVVGVAREAAPLVESKLRLPRVSPSSAEPPSADVIKITIEDPELCGRYVGVLVRNVRIGDSPDWLKNRLIAAGMRPINNVVDITNYVMLELGQPLHAFDYNLLHGKQIRVRTANPGERIVSLDGAERELQSDALVIADADRAVAVAGIMGGIDSEVSKQTQDILIESANFNSVSVRRTSKRLGLVTESSYRFERGVDPSVTDVAALRAAELMRDLAGGEVAGGIVDVRPRPVEPLRITLRPQRVNAVLGTDIDTQSMIDYLGALEIETVLEDGVLQSTVPTFRTDITREIDLVEEVGRAFGYEKLGTTLPDTPSVGKDSPEGLFKDRVRGILMSCGAQEVLTHSLVDSGLAELAGKAKSLVRLRNTLSEELDSMRVALLPNLLQVIGRNQAYGTSDVNVFEIGKIYYRGADGEISEKLSIAGAMVGSLWNSNWGLPSEALNIDFFICKGAVENLLDALGVGPATYVEAGDDLLHPTRAAKVLLGGREIGILGEVSPGIIESMDLRDRPCGFELDFAALMESVPGAPRFTELPRYPAMDRHVSVVVPDDVKYADLARLVRESGEGLVEDVKLLDVYKGEQVGTNLRSLTLSIVFRSREKTLTDAEANVVSAAIRETLIRSAGASFRQ